MKRYTPYIVVVAILVVFFTGAYYIKNLSNWQKNVDIGSFSSQKRCAKLPIFLSELRIPQPIMIDLSQSQYRGIAFRFGKNLSKVLYYRNWGRFDHLGTYAIDPNGNVYLTPMPFISVNSKTFDFQRNIYKLDSKNRKLSIFMKIDEVNASLNNPFGIISIDYDCDTDTLWVSTLDRSDYTHQRGRIYHIDIKTKKILDRLEGVDALSIKLIRTSKGKYLLAGLAKENSLYAYRVIGSKLNPTPIKLFHLPDANEHIRSIKIIGENRLKIQTIPFLYTLVAQTVEGDFRQNYIVVWDEKTHHWKF